MCQEGTRGGINLSDWTKGAGLSAIAVTAWVWIMATLSAITGSGNFLIVMTGVLTADTFFWIVWWIWGVVILATNENNQCVVEGKGMAIMAIINLVIGGVRFFYLKFLTALAE